MNDADAIGTGAARRASNVIGQAMFKALAFISLNTSLQFLEPTARILTPSTFHRMKERTIVLKRSTSYIQIKTVVAVPMQGM